jgi:flagellar assembly protein FliH
MAGVIPKEELAAYKRWNVDSFDRKLPILKPVTPNAQKKIEPSEPEIVTTMGLPTVDDIERINEEARTEGYQAGFEEGRLAGEATLADSITSELARFSALIGNLQISLTHMDQTIAEQVLDLALEVASQVIRSTIAVRNETLLPVIREAITALPLHHGHVMLHLNPADASMVREQIGEQLAQTGTQIIDDTEIAPGGCTLKAGTSEIDATLETRWKRVLEAIGSEPREWLSTP